MKSLREILKRDIHHGEAEARLVKHWKQELAALDHAQPVPRDGVDYSWARPDPHTMRAKGVTFAIRYLSGVQGKDLTHGEAHALSAAGIDVVVVWETTAGRMLEGHIAGRADATRASQLARQCGQPAGRPIYFACDEEVTTVDQLERCQSYLQGAGDAIGPSRVGVYGSYALCEHIHATNTCRYLWQTLAWSHGQWSPHAQLRQIENARSLAGGLVDIDRAMAADFGQWRV